MALPTLDFGKYLHGNAEEKLELGTALVQSFKDFGFVKLINHGVPEETVEAYLNMVCVKNLSSELILTRTADCQVFQTAPSY